VRVLDIDPAPFHALDFLEAAAGGTRKPRRLPFLRGRVAALPVSLEAVILAADLQGPAQV
jgi:hypothetical protein